MSCSNCARPICTECMTATSVGMRCPECSKQTTRVVRGAAAFGTEPRVTYVLIAACVIAFLGSGQFGLGGSSSGNEIFRNGALLGYGSLDGLTAIGVHEGQYWRLITGGFLHSGLIHIGFNMYLLYYLGRMLEPLYGPWRFGAIYFTALLAGSFGALIQNPNGFTVGASGAVFGLMGAAFMEMRARGEDPFRSEIGMLIVLNLGLSFVISNVSIGGHIGGLVGGALVAILIGEADKRRLPRWTAFVICAVVAAAATVGAIVASAPPS
ncbi:MAG TPA: rhomboid family intramembrane serine protease [Baekduia sp.]|nr:rhomboid family intramembrane serine protease [Baekduia sp.]